MQGVIKDLVLYNLDDVISAGDLSSSCSALKKKKHFFFKFYCLSNVEKGLKFPTS